MTTVLHDLLVTFRSPTLLEQRFVARGYLKVYRVWMLVAMLLLGVGLAGAWPVALVGVAVWVISGILDRCRVKSIALSSEQIKWQIGSRSFQKSWNEIAVIDPFSLPSGKQAVEVWFRDGSGFTILENEYARFAELLEGILHHAHSLASDTTSDLDQTAKMLV